MLNNRPKIFGIGFQKTGTKSLAAALRILGYRVTGPNWGKEPDIAETALQRALAVASSFDAFQDNPWALLYRELDEHFPHSKFILTIRPVDEWYRSALNYFGLTTSPVREWIYGTGNGSPVGHEAEFRRRYEAHNEAVLGYFSGRPGDLLVMNLGAGDGWRPLCKFLGHSAPNLPFPKRNVGGRRA